MIDKLRPIVAAVHPNLIDELKIRQRQLESETGRPTKGGLTIFSQIAAEELKYSRLSGVQILRDIISAEKVSPVEIEWQLERRLFVPYEDFKRLLLLASALGKRKDQCQIKLEIQKIKGLKKNEVKFLW